MSNFESIGQQSYQLIFVENKRQNDWFYWRVNDVSADC